MDQAKLGIDFLNLLKSSYLTTIQMHTLMQDQSARVMTNLIDQGLGAQQGGKKALEEWLDTMKRSTDEYRKLVDEGFKKMEGHFKKAE